MCSKLKIMTGTKYTVLRTTYTSPKALRMTYYIAAHAMDFVFLNLEFYHSRRSLKRVSFPTPWIRQRGPSFDQPSRNNAWSDWQDPFCLQRPIFNFRLIDAHKKRHKQYELRQLSQLPCKGKRFSSFANDRHDNASLYNPNLLKFSRFLTALRMQSGTTSDRVCLNKAIPQATVKRVETLTHILGQCIYKKQQRIHRYDEIRDLVAYLSL
jgi:hypothetical protein